MEHKLKVFCTVAETRSFSKTSEIIHLTQPAVSLQIQALEEKYETKLFDRSSSKVNLTPAGEVLYKYAKDILALYASAEKVISEMTGLVKGSITIGAGSTIGNYLLPSVIADFRKAHPKIKVHLLIGNMQKVIELLNSGNINIGFVEGDVKRHKMFSEKLISDELLVIVPQHHQWAQRKEISVTELIDEPFIFREAGSSTRQIIEKFFSRHGITTQDMKVSMVLGSTEAIKDAVENGLGVSIISQWAARKESKYGILHLINLKEEKIVRNFSLLIYKNSVSTHAVDEFLTCMRAYPFDELLS
jgi:DNA-binding transcriptional LysR family regulator